MTMTSPCFRLIGRTSLALFLAFSFSIPHVRAAGEADFFLTPNKSAVSPGEFFTIKVTLSASAPIDTIRLNATYPPDLFQGVVVQNGSALPSISPGNGINNTNGNLSFGAFTLGDPASGSALVATMTFKSLKAGEGAISLTSSSLALRDGDNLYSGGGVSVPIDSILPPSVPGGAVTEPPKENDGGVITTPKGTVHIFSSSRPDPERWYSSRDVVFSWTTDGEKPQEFWFVFDQNPQTDPAALSSRDSHSPDQPSVTYTADADGVWYLHARAVYTGGYSSDVSHIPVKIDTEAPQSLAVDADRTKVIAGDDVTVSFGATENLSGVIYAVSENGSEYVPAKSPYVIKNIPLGDMLFAVRATDGAGNTSYANVRIRAYDPNSPFLQLYSFGRSFFSEPKNILIFTLILASGIVVFCGILFLFARAWRKRKNVQRF
jgi:hypothetical protein